MEVIKMQKYAAVLLLLLLGCATENATLVQTESSKGAAESLIAGKKG